MGDYLDKNKPMGPNVKRLLSAFIARVAIPPGTKDPFTAGIETLTVPGRYQEVARKAMGQVEIALEAMKAAPDNPYGTDDEVIAGAILEHAGLKGD